MEIVVPHAPDEVFRRITGLSEWWPEDIDGELSPAVEFELRVGQGHYSKNRVIDFEPGRRFAWITTESFRKADGFDWTGTKMIFELLPGDNGTLIRYTYDGVVLEQEAELLTRICDAAIKDMLFNYLAYGKAKHDFTVTIELDKPAAEVFRALTENVAQWWGGKDLSGSTASLDDEFVIHHQGAHYSKQKIVELIPNERLIWLVTDSELSWLNQDKQEWTGTKMMFELAEDYGKTQLRFTHIGLTPDKECYDACTGTGWDIVIRDYLYNYIMEGRSHFF